MVYKKGSSKSADEREEGEAFSLRESSMPITKSNYFHQRLG